MLYRQYEIVRVNLEPTIGSEINKVRPCVIVSPDEMNRNLNTVVIAPITHTSKAYPTRVNITTSKIITGHVAIDQIRMVDKQRILGKLDILGRDDILEIKEVISRTFVE
jgi:mRNA interferase MazF